MEVRDAGQATEIDEALKAWRQGDCVLGEQWFAFRIDAKHPLTEEASAAAEAGVDLAESEVLGFMVLTQTCDIVRASRHRPFVEVAPLSEVDEPTLHDIKKGRRPNYAYVASLAEQRLVAHLDRVMTVEKAVVAQWERVQGCLSQADERQLSLALARKRARWAFPDDFNALARPLTERMKSKYGKESDEGRAIRSLREIRVRAAPSWAADEVRLHFWFIREESEEEPKDIDWDASCREWIGKMKTRGRFVSIDGVPVYLEDMTAKDYVESDLLDLDNLSAATE